MTLVLLILGFWVHWRFGLTASSLPAFRRDLGIMLVVFFICAGIEPSFARLYGKVVLLPFYATIVLNNWLYGGSHWVFRTILRLLYIRRVSAFVALLGELGLFALLWHGVELLLRRYWL